MNAKLPDGTQSKFQKPDYTCGRWKIDPAFDYLPLDLGFHFSLILGRPIFYLIATGWFRADLTWQRDGAFEACVDQWGHVHYWRKLVLPMQPEAQPDSNTQSFAL